MPISPAGASLPLPLALALAYWTKDEASQERREPGFRKGQSGQGSLIGETLRVYLPLPV